MPKIDCKGKEIREINTAIRAGIAQGPVEVVNPGAMHNLAVGIIAKAEINIKGSAGYYCGGLIDGPTIHVDGNAGWGLAEGMMHGDVRVKGNAGNSAAASIRGGSVAIHGDAGARAGIAMKGGLLAIQGDAGMLAGFLMQKGVIIICGNAGASVASSMYEGVVFVGGKAEDLGSDTKVESPTPEDEKFLAESLSKLGMKAPASFQKIVSARTLWNFKASEFAQWKDAL